MMACAQCESFFLLCCILMTGLSCSIVCRNMGIVSCPVMNNTDAWRIDFPEIVKENGYKHLDVVQLGSAN